MQMSIRVRTQIPYSLPCPDLLITGYHIVIDPPPYAPPSLGPFPTIHSLHFIIFPPRRIS